MVTEVSDTTISLTWSESATSNGIVDAFLISYGIEGTGDGATVTSETESVQLMRLDPFTEYTVTVTCVNGAGPGNSSSPVDITTLLHQQRTVRFQLRLTGISDCVQWKEIQANEKKEEVVAGVTRGVNDICQCDFSRESFRDIDITAGFQCFDDSPTAVTFRAEISDSLKADSSQLIAYIEQWVSSEPTIVVQSSRLSIDSSCTVEITSFSEPECNDVTASSSEDSNSTTVGPIVGSILGGFLVMLLAALIPVLVILSVRSRKKKASYSVEVDSIYETVLDPPPVSLELTNTAAAVDGETPIATEGNPSYLIHISAKENPAYCSTQRGIVDSPTYATPRNDPQGPPPPTAQEPPINPPLSAAEDPDYY
jgi:hypothetical protein